MTKKLDCLDSLKKQLSELHPDEKTEKNLEIAIELAERNFFLASSLVTTRVIAYIIAQINVPEIIKASNEKRKKPLSYIDLIIHLLRKQGIIPENRANDIPNLVKYGKGARVWVSHDISYFPSASECLSQLGSCFLLLSLVGRLTMVDFFNEIYKYLVADATQNVYSLLKDLTPDKKQWIREARLRFEQDDGGFWIGNYYTNLHGRGYDRRDWVELNKRVQHVLRDKVIQDFIQTVETNLGIKLSHENIKLEVMRDYGKDGWQEFYGTYLEKSTP